MNHLASLLQLNEPLLIFTVLIGIILLAPFLFPFILGLFISKFFLHLDNRAALLVSIMFSTHTLVAYPIVRKLGINRDIAVLTAMGGTIITDTIVLLILPGFLNI